MDSQISTTPKSNSLLRVLLFLFVIVLVIKLFFPAMLAMLIAGPFLIGLPFLLLFALFSGLFAFFIAGIGLLLCTIVLFATLFLFVGTTLISWPLLALIVVAVFLYSNSRNKQGLSHE